MNTNTPTGEINRRSFIRGCGAVIGACAIGGAPFPQPAHPAPAQEPGVREALYYDKLPDKKIQCRLCPHECRVADLERGSCGVRENRAGTYHTLVYGTPCTAHTDPVEKKPVFHFFPGATAFSIATAGCNFVCKFCQNWEISQKRPEQIKSYPLSPKEVVAAAQRQGAKMIAHTYTEPVIFYEYMLDCARTGKTAGIPNIMISNGYIREKPMRELLPFLGAVKIDLKAFSDSFYRDMCAGTLRPVLDTLTLLKAEGVWLEIVVLLIPTLNDSLKEIKQMSAWIYKELGPFVPLHFTRFYPTFMVKNLPPTPPETCMNARSTALDAGLRYVYVGNMLSGAESTHCHSCGKLIIERMRYHTTISGMKGNRCKYCDAVIPGVFS